MSGERCPACDAEALYLSKLEVFALGVAIGAGFKTDVAQMMCDRHRTAYTLAGMKMSMKINRDREET